MLFEENMSGEWGGRQGVLRPGRKRRALTGRG